MRERLDRNRAALAVALFAAVLVLGAATQLVPRLTQRDEVVSSTPVRVDLAAIAPIVVQPGARACLSDVTFDRAAGVARIALAPSATSANATRLALETSAPGYRASTVASVEPLRAYEYEIPFTPPHRSAIGTLCIHNLGPHATPLAGTADPRALTRSTLVVAGRRQAQAFSLTLLEARRRSPLARVSQLVDRAAALSAVGPWLLWLLIPLLLIGGPTAVGAALWLALREPEPPGVGAVQRGNRLPLRNTEASRTFPPQGSP